MLKGIRITAALAAAVSIAACSPQGSDTTPNHSVHTSNIIVQPNPIDPGGHGGGSPTPAPTSCLASDPSCAGPWTFGEGPGNPFDPSSYAYGGSGNGTGYMTFSIICDDPAACTADGYDGQDLVINEHYNGSGSTSADIGSEFSGCTTTFSFGTDCSGWQLAKLGRQALPGLICDGSQKAIGSWFNGTDTQANEIKQIYEVQMTAPVMQTVLGWVYQTFGSGYYFQLNLSVSAGVAVAGVSTGSPIVPTAGLTPLQLTQALNAAIKASSIVSMPIGWQRALTTGKVAADTCFQIPWDGTYPT